MMDTFLPTIGVVSAIVSGFVFLTLFFKIVGRKSAKRRSQRIAAFDLGNDLVTVHLKNNRVLEKVRLRGMWQDDPGVMPSGIHDMIAIVQADGTRIFIRSEMVEMIEIPPKAA